MTGLLEERIDSPETKITKRDTQSPAKEHLLVALLLVMGEFLLSLKQSADKLEISSMREPVIYLVV